MSLRIISNALVIVYSVGYATHFVYKLCLQKKKPRVQREEINEVIMFSYGEPAIKSKYSKAMISKGLDRLLHYMNAPRQTLDLCMYVLTNMELTNAILKLNFKGVKVRIIIDADMAFSSGSTVKKLEKHGIPVRWMKSTSLMHHKFCIVDALSDKRIPFIMMGSLNWTNNALNGNWEDVVVTSQKELVEQYQLEFERLWSLFKPIVDI